MACKACLEGKRRRKERLESLRKHKAARAAELERRRQEANQNGSKVKFLNSNGEG